VKFLAAAMIRGKRKNVSALYEGLFQKSGFGEAPWLCRGYLLNPGEAAFVCKACALFNVRQRSTRITHTAAQDKPKSCRRSHWNVTAKGMARSSWKEIVCVGRIFFLPDEKMLSANSKMSNNFLHFCEDIDSKG